MFDKESLSLVPRKHNACTRLTQVYFRCRI